MRTVGKRKIPGISEKASSALLERGCEFNDNLHSLPSGNSTYFPKGIFRYKTAEEGNKHWEDSVVLGMAKYNR